MSSNTFFCQSVLNIPFGSSRSVVKKALVDRFGEYKVYGENENGELRMYDFNMGNFRFDSGRFEFQYSGSLSFFNFAEFQKHYKVDDVEGAKSDRDYLISLIIHKYQDDYHEFLNDQGFKCCGFGTNPRDDEKYLGIVSLSKDYGKDGIKRLYLTLSYGPIY